MAEIQPVGSNQPYVNKSSNTKTAVKIAAGTAALAAVALTAFAAHKGDVFKKAKDVISSTKGQKLSEKLKTIFKLSNFTKTLKGIGSGYKTMATNFIGLFHKKGANAAEEAVENVEQVAGNVDKVADGVDKVAENAADKVAENVEKAVENIGNAVQ